MNEATRKCADCVIPKRYTAKPRLYGGVSFDFLFWSLAYRQVGLPTGRQACLPTGLPAYAGMHPSVIRER